MYFYQTLGAFSPELLLEVVRAYGTPLYCYSLRRIRDNYQRLATALRPAEVYYSVKANPAPSVAKALLAEGASFEVVSIGELRMLLDSKVSPSKVIFVGPGKTEHDLKAAVSDQVKMIVIESRLELACLIRICSSIGDRANVLVRVNPTFSFRQSFEVMANTTSKFGVDEEACPALLNDLREPARFLGFHVYAASQILNAQNLLTYHQRLIDMFIRLSEKSGRTVHVIDLGGGFGIPYSCDDPEFDLGRYSQGFACLASDLKHQFGDSLQIWFEVGRYIVGDAGVFLTRIVDIKVSRGKRFIITDGGMNAFSRPAFHRINHPVKVITRLCQEQIWNQVDIVGPCCTPYDTLATNLNIPECTVGDVIALGNAGAYGCTMSMTRFHSRGEPREVFLESE